MENKTKRDKMPIGDRAKQFMPFAAVVGLEEALEQKRREMMWRDRVVLSEEMQSALNEKLSKLRKGDGITVTYYRDGEYATLSGAVQRVNPVERWICVCELYIPFDDIGSIDTIG